MSIEIRHLRKRFGAFRALDDVSLDIRTGELVALLGPSGCGKTSLLRIVAGLETPDAGTVLVQGEDTSGLAVQRRRVGFVFQHYALFRHMNVFDNVAFGLRVRPRAERPSEREIRARVDRLLDLVQIAWMKERFPAQLSGGQKQRVALARALAVDPRVLLLDEPFGALDAKVRKELRRWLRRLHEELEVTTVFVTHDQEEAMEVADRVVVMNAGRIEQVGTPDEVYATPANAFVYGFLGSANRFEGHERAGVFEGAGLRHPVAAGSVAAGSSDFAELSDIAESAAVAEPSGISEPSDYAESSDLPGSPAVAYVRPHELEVQRYSPGASGLAARLVRRYSRGAAVMLELEHEGADQPMEAELTREEAVRLGLCAGDRVLVRPAALAVFRRGA